MKQILAINMAMTLDGKVARPDGKWHGMTTEKDKRQMDIYRSNSDALIVGKNSITNDNPFVKLRFVENAINPRPVILIRRGSLTPDKRIFEESDHTPLVICTRQNKKEIEESLRNRVDIQALDSDDIEPKKVMGILSRLGYERILLEGGPKLNYSFFRQGLVNRIHLTIVPYLIGQRTLPSIADGDVEIPGYEKADWKLTSCNKEGDEIFLIYDRKS
ncbi:RibD family protein [Leptospira sp. GIMC2001]|uniref:RibD family protein n=1 Tax=Leptospira sp. GIMC2001 TaxID=1513297 RepID=UPI00234BEC30|nr:RibD family protein [Leptospira sp. GIMC2001]WCL49293.1 RibD family protein [Leptospira sp. GIMC2001]